MYLTMAHERTGTFDVRRHTATSENGQFAVQVFLAGSAHHAMYLTVAEATQLAEALLAAATQPAPVEA